MCRQIVLDVSVILETERAGVLRAAAVDIDVPANLECVHRSVIETAVCRLARTQARQHCIAIEMLPF